MTVDHSVQNCGLLSEDYKIYGVKVAVYMNVLVMLLLGVTCAGGADYKARDTRDTAPPLPPPVITSQYRHHTANICYIVRARRYPIRLHFSK